MKEKEPFLTTLLSTDSLYRFMLMEKFEKYSRIEWKAKVDWLTENNYLSAFSKKNNNAGQSM